MTTEEKKCTEILKADVDSYTQEQYEQMEKELSEKINNLIEETENKYCVAPTVQEGTQDRRISVFILNKGIHNNPPFQQSETNHLDIENTVSHGSWNYSENIQ